MFGSAADNLPFIRYIAELPWGAHWTSPALAAHLRDVSLGRWGRLGASSDLWERLDAARVAAEEERDSEKDIKHVQAAAMSAMRDSRGPFDFVRWLQRPGRRLFCAGPPVEAVDWDLVVRSLCDAPGPVAISALRLWAGALPTTCRLHLDVETCVFGCDGEPDSGAHYVRCAALRAAFSHACVADLQRPGEVAGLVPPDPLRAAIISRTHVLWRRMRDVDGARLGLLVSALLRTWPWRGRAMARQLRWM